MRAVFVSSSVMPKGVEHLIAVARCVVESSCVEFSDAERR